MTDRHAKRLVGWLAAAVVARMAFHAVYVPAFEGPDEPQHLARILDFVRLPLPDAFAGTWVDADVVESVLAYPCPHPEQGCRRYGEVPGAFNLLYAAPRRPTKTVMRIPNDEAKQPPLAYALYGLPLRLIGFRGDPPATLLGVRMINVMLVAVALFGPLRRVFRGAPALACAGLIALLSPGACEAFARCSNDAAVFLWAAAVLAALDRSSRTSWLVALAAAGPMLKLTVLPISVFAVVALWLDRRRGAAVGGAIASALVFPIQALRGWMTGGALELQRRAPIVETLSGWIVGLARSAYGVIKAPYWAGGWHNHRVPGALVVLYLAFLAWTAAALRIDERPRRLLAHAAAATVVISGTVAFAVAVRGNVGVWGGLAAWYLWGWSPWLAVAGMDLFAIEERFRRPLIAAESLFILAANLAWFSRSAALYAG